MIIDFHTHIFPDSLAPRALESLVNNIRVHNPQVLLKRSSLANPATDLTLADTLSKMDKNGIDISVVQPVITKPTQTVKLNEFAAKIMAENKERIVSFGGIHPQSDDWKRDIDFVCSLGLKGLKFHAEYQGFVVDAPEMLRIYDYAFSKGLIILHHAGADLGMPKPYKSSPAQFARIAKELKGGVTVAAHFGGHEQWDEVEKYIVGTDIFIDTSMGFEYYSEEQFLRIVRAHGANKVLFATDCPWSNAEQEIKALKGTALTPEEKEMIFSANAKKLLKI